MLTQEVGAIADVLKMDISGRVVADVDVDNVQEWAVLEKCRLYDLKSVISLRRTSRFDLARQLISRCDVLLLAGGNMIMDLESFSYYSFLCDRYATMAKKMHKKVVFAFVGVGKIRTNSQIKRWKRVLEKSDFIAVRDSISKKSLLQNLGIKKPVAIWKDPVFILESPEKHKRKNTVGINIYLGAGASIEEREALKNSYVYLIESLQKEYDVVLFSTEINDEPGIREIYQVLHSTDKVRMVLSRSLEDLLSLYQNVDCILATRMHSFIIAITQHIPAIVLAWDKKIYGVSTDIGLSDVVFDIHGVGEEKQRILAAINTIMNEHDKNVKRMEEINKQVKTEFSECRRELQRVLIEGSYEISRNINLFQ